MCDRPQEGIRKDKSIKNYAAFDLLRPSYNYDDYAEQLVSNMGRYEKIKNDNQVQPAVKKSYVSQLKPVDKTFQKEFGEKVYESIYYKSRQIAPLAKSRKPIAIPENVTNENTTFGILSEKDGSGAYGLIFPERSRDEILQEDLKSHKYYKLSHEDYFLGEKIRRNYDEKFYDSKATFGVVTDADPSGKFVKRALNPCLGKNLCEINCIHHQFKRQRKGVLGKPLERICPGKTLSPDYTYGKSTILKISGKNIIYNKSHSFYENEFYVSIAHLKVIRRTLSKKGEHLLGDVQRICESEDHNNTGYLPCNLVFSILKSQSIHLNEGKMKFLSEHYGIVNDKNEINYVRFLGLLNIREPIPDFGMHPKYPEALDKSKLTTYREFCANLSEDAHCDQRPAGVTASSVNNCNKDLEVFDVSEVIYPSTLSLYGVNYKDFLQPRSMDEIRTIFLKVGFPLEDNNAFEELWNTALKLEDSAGNEVSVQSFLHALREDSNNMASFTNNT